MPARPPPSRLDLLQVFRAAAALAVVGFHAVLTRPDGTLCAGGRLLPSGWLGVDAFFCLSGFVMGWVHGADIGLPERARAFAEKRLRRIYPPYLACLLLLLVWALTQGRTGEWTPASLFQSFLLVPPPGALVLPAAWTLVYEVFFYTLFCAAIVLGPRAARIGAALWLGGIVLYAGVPAGDAAPFCAFAFSPFHLEFLGGLLAARWVPRPRALLLAGGGLALALPLLVCGYRLGWWPPGPGDSLLQKGALALGFSSLLLGLGKIESEQPVRVPRGLLLLGAASYSIYLVHEPFLKGIGAVPEPLLSFLLGHRAGLVLFLVLAAAAGIGAGIVFHLAVERPLLRRDRGRAPLPSGTESASLPSPPCSTSNSSGTIPRPRSSGWRRGGVATSRP